MEYMRWLTLFLFLGPSLKQPLISADADQISNENYILCHTCYKFYYITRYELKISSVKSIMKLKTQHTVNYQLPYIIRFMFDETYCYLDNFYSVYGHPNVKNLFEYASRSGVLSRIYPKWNSLVIFGLTGGLTHFYMII